MVAGSDVVVAVVVLSGAALPAWGQAGGYLYPPLSVNLALAAGQSSIVGLLQPDSTSDAYFILWPCLSPAPLSSAAKAKPL
jgi:hypothetical protein